jgi:transcription factor E
MLENLLKEVISLVAGKPAEEIVGLLDTQKYINEFVIAKKLNLTINQARNILYKISDYGLVSSIRKKDKRKGWYTYFWKIEILKTLEFLRENLLKKIDNAEHQIKSRETKRFYVCERCHIELSEENALISNFTCNECGSILTLKDNIKLIRDLKRNKEKLERDLKIVDEEIAKERGKEGKKRGKEMRKEEKIRVKAVKLRKAKMKKLREASKKIKNPLINKPKKKARSSGMGKHKAKKKKAQKKSKKAKRTKKKRA